MKGVEASKKDGGHSQVEGRQLREEATSAWAGGCTSALCQPSSNDVPNICARHSPYISSLNILTTLGR